MRREVPRGRENQRAENPTMERMRVRRRSAKELAKAAQEGWGGDCMAGRRAVALAPPPLFLSLSSLSSSYLSFFGSKNGAHRHRTPLFPTSHAQTGKYT